MGKTIHSEGRNLVLKVLQFFENEKKNGHYCIPIDQVDKRTCAATGISRSTLTRIKREVKQACVPPPCSSPEPDASPTTSMSNTASSTNTAPSTSSVDNYPSPSASNNPMREVKLSTPGKKRKPYKKKITVDDFNICAIRNIINSMYTVKKEVPTLKKILAAAKKDLNFQGGRTFLRNILVNQLGYKFKKCKNARTVLIQKANIAAWRERYLRRMKENSDLGADKKPVTYLDETWIHSHYTVSKCWQNIVDSSVKKNFNPGQRWILVHAGGEHGFIPGADLLYKCKSKTGDYHHEMNTENFLKWLNEKIIPNLPSNGIVVIDNAPYHSTQSEKPPTSTSTKSEMQQWLHNNNVSFDERMRKRELYHLIKQTKPPKKYVVDDLLKQHGHEVVRLPPYHCDLNPIEYIWNLIKQRVAYNNVDQLEKNIEKLTRDAIASITASDWKKEVNHVERLQQVLDFTQYFLDLAAANRAGAAEWIAEYNLTQYYGLHDISSHSLHNLADRLRIGTPHETMTFHKYLRAFSVKQESNEVCDGACAHQHFCAITCLEHLSYRQCVEAAASALAAAGKSAQLVSPFKNLILNLFVALAIRF